MICETAKDGAKKNKLDRRVGGGGGGQGDGGDGVTAGETADVMGR